MTRSDRHHQFHLMSAVHLGCELACGPANRHQMLGSYNYLALWNEDAIDRPAIQDACNTAAEIASDHCIYDISRQADNVRARRFSVQHSHLAVPQQEAREHQTTTVHYRTELFCHNFVFRFCNAMQLRRVQFEVHS